MAQEQQIRKKPRIRMTAPTVRERAEAARAKADRPSRTRFLTVIAGRFKTLVGWPFKRLAKLRLPDKRPFRTLRKVFRPVFRILRWLMPKYFINSWREVKLVTWPGRRETWKLTLAVFVFAVVFGLAVSGVDYILEYVFKRVVLK